MGLPWRFRWHVSLGLLLVAFALVATLRSAPSPVFAGPNCNTTGSIDSEELRFLELINDYRAENGRVRLILSNSLNRSAAWKAQHVADNNYMAHDDVPIGRKWIARIRDCGYGHNTFLGENIAGGDRSASGAFNIWRNSPGHNDQMLGDTHRAIGIGRARSAAGYWFWVTDFGGVVDARISGGDVDCNGRVNTIDAGLILQRAAGLVGSLACASEADADGSGSVDAADALIVLQYAAGLVH